MVNACVGGTVGGDTELVSLTRAEVAAEIQGSAIILGGQDQSYCSQTPS